MKAQWYSDKRDLVKWGVLLELARRFRADHILQVLYLRPSEWGHLEIDGEQFELPSAVVQLFRNPFGISDIRAPARVEVVPDIFEDRNQYMSAILKRINPSHGTHRIVFLDPDTVLEPRKPRLEHVLVSELAAIWDKMSPGDVLVCYQHQTNKNGTPWIDAKKKQFEVALELKPGSARLARAPEIAPDVAFFFVRKARKPKAVAGGAQVVAK